MTRNKFLLNLLQWETSKFSPPWHIPRQRGGGLFMCSSLKLSDSGQIPTEQRIIYNHNHSHTATLYDFIKHLHIAFLFLSLTLAYS